MRCSAVARAARAIVGGFGLQAISAVAVILAVRVQLTRRPRGERGTVLRESDGGMGLSVLCVTHP